MRLRATKTLNGAGLFYSTYVKDYLDRVTAADATAGNRLGLERGTTQAINAAIESLVAVGFLGVSSGIISQDASAIKSKCFLCGARTLTGALVPVVGAAPTNFNFVANDYNSKTGLGDPTNVAKYLDSGRSNSADPQNNKHVAVNISTTPNNGTALIGSLIRSPAVSATQIFYSAGSYSMNVNAATSLSYAIGGSTGFVGVGRNSATSQQARIGAATVSDSVSSNNNHTLNTLIFARNDAGTVNSYANSRIRIYSIGEFVDMAVLRSIHDQFTASIAAAIP